MLAVKKKLSLSVILAPLFIVGCAAPDFASNTASVDGYIENEEFAMATDRAPSAKTLYAMANILHSQGRDPELATVLARIIERYPEFLPAYSDLAEVHLRQQRPGDAIRVLSMGVEVVPEDPVMLNNLGMCWFFSEKYEESLANFLKAAANSPNDKQFRANAALPLAMLGRYDEALALFNQVMDSAEAHYNLSILCEARDDFGRAELEAQKAIELAAENGIDLPDSW